MATARRVLGTERLPVGSLRVAWPALASALLGFSVLVSVGVADGGVFPRTWRLATLALCALAAAVLLARKHVAFARLEWAVLASLAAYTAWIAASASWSGHSSVSMLQAERGVVYVAGLLAVLLVVERRTVPHLLGGIVAGITAVSAYGLGEYVLRPPPLDPFEGRLLHEPFGYANALGIFAAIGILVAVGLALAAALPLLAGAGGRIRLPVAVLLAALAAAAVAVVLVVSGGPRRLGSLAGENRPDYWQVAWEDYRAHPVLGSGAGTYGDYWLAHPGNASFTRTAHNLYLQSLAELGPVGLVLVLTAVGLPLLRLRRRLDPVAVTAAAGYLAFLLHAGIDWDWEMPAAGLAGLFCGAALLVATRPLARVGMPVWMRAALFAPAIVLAVVAVVRLDTGPRLPFGP
jgi:O-antigen ligase